MSTQPTVVPMLAYADGPAAMDWLAQAFGFVETTRWVNDDGHLEHGEMAIGDASIMIATPSPAYEGPAQHRTHCAAADAWLAAPYVIDGVLVRIHDLKEHRVRAEAAGATMLSGIEETPFGHLYRVEDPEGHRWMFLEPADE